MGMGLGSLILGTVVKRVMDILVWATTFRILSIVFFAVFFLGSFHISSPKAEKVVTGKGGTKNYSFFEMLKTMDFWMIFLWDNCILRWIGDSLQCRLYGRRGGSYKGHITLDGGHGLRWKWGGETYLWCHCIIYPFICVMLGMALLAFLPVGILREGEVNRVVANWKLGNREG